jgi:hypothetical protein
MRSRRPRLTRIALVVTIALLETRPAMASLEGARRSLENIVLCPAELVVFPVVAGRTLHHNMQVANYTTPQKIFIAPFAFAWLSLVQASFGFARGTAGFVGLPLALAYAGSKNDPAAHLDLSRYPALVDHRTRYFDFTFGVYQAWR